MLPTLTTKVVCLKAYNDLNDKEFKFHYEDQIRRFNASHENTKYIISDEHIDYLFYEYLRTLGVSPDNITIYRWIPDKDGSGGSNEKFVKENKYRYNIINFTSKYERDINMINNSTHSIIWRDLRENKRSNDHIIEIMREMRENALANFRIIMY